MKASVMKAPWGPLCSIVLVLLCYRIDTCNAQDYDGGGVDAKPPPISKEQERCNGIFLSYNGEAGEKLYPLVKNVTAQAWEFQSTATVVNMGIYELKAWKMHIGFSHNELLVSVDGAAVLDGDSFPIRVGKNGTSISGFPKTDLKTAIDTAGDYEQMQAQVTFKGTVFGLKPKTTPMPKSIKLDNDGYKCPAATKKASNMYVCCTKDPKFKLKNTTIKYLPRRDGDLTITYDVLQAYGNKYLAQVTMSNNNPLGRLDHWNLTWEWMRDEFIYSMRGAYTRRRDPSECIYGPQGKYYAEFDFSNVQSCAKRPVISDLPSEKENDEKIGKLPYCCRNGTILPKLMNSSWALSVFQLEVFKLPPDLNRTAITPPQSWKIAGQMNPTYKCGQPIRVDPTRFPDPNGLDGTTSAIASWQVVCNISKPEPRKAKCCVSFSAYYADSVVPCNTCACGCEQTTQCNPNSSPLPLPPEALLVPFANRTLKAKAWWDINNPGKSLPKKLPCPDNCGVSINWHVDTDYKSGWTARMTLFNWEPFAFENWFAAIQMKKAFDGYENVYSFNGTKMPEAGPLKDIIFVQGLPGLNYLVGEVNGSNPRRDPPVPGKQQSVISFLKKNKAANTNVPGGDGFPTRVFFNGEECALPKQFPKINSASGSLQQLSFLPSIFVAVLTLVALH